jgi:hypothetical protein
MDLYDGGMRWKCPLTSQNCARVSYCLDREVATHPVLRVVRGQPARKMFRRLDEEEFAVRVANPMKGQRCSWDLEISDVRDDQVRPLERYLFQQPHDEPFIVYCLADTHRPAQLWPFPLVLFGFLILSF